jgi:hypothetical protein
MLPMPLGAFQPRKSALGGSATVFPWGREQELLAFAMAGSYIYYILGSHTDSLYIGVTNP